MKFNPTTQHDSIVYAARDYVDANSTNFPVAKIARYASRAMEMITGWILESDDRFDWDDPNHIDQPVIYLDLVSGKQDYLVFKDATENHILKIKKVAVKDRNGKYKVVTPTDSRSEDAVNYIQKDSENVGVPTKYDKMGVQILLDPIPDYSFSPGIKAYIQRESTIFEESDTTKEPGFASHFHFLVPLICAYMYAQAKGLKRASSLREDIYGVGDEMMGGAKGKLMAFYASRNEDENVQLQGMQNDPR